MTEPVWLVEEAVLAIHARLADEHRSPVGIRDRGLLVSALARPLHVATHGDPSLTELAAALAFGIARNHPFVDGNKRIALMAAFVFLARNGLHLNASEVEAVQVFVALAAGDLSEADLARWLGGHVDPWSP